MQVLNYIKQILAQRGYEKKSISLVIFDYVSRRIFDQNLFNFQN